ncbi:MAG: hypothetical protein ABIV06_10430 [Thermoanaerobaculia bacterium]
MRVVTITFAGDDSALVARLERFGDTLPRSPWWRASVGGYCASAGDCIGDGRPGLALQLQEKLPVRVHGVDVAALLRREAAAGHLDAADPENVFLVYLPAGVTLFDANHDHFCGGGPRAFHRALRHEGRQNGFSVVPRCGDEAELTATASHELVELATNPDTSRRGFAIEQDSVGLPFTAAGVEPMDPCGLITRDTNRAIESGFAVQRAWSNRSAALGTDPCGSDPAGTPFAALVPRQPTVLLREVGDRATVVLDAASVGLDAAWTVSAIDLSRGPTGERYFEARLDRATVAAGDTVQLTLELLRKPPEKTGTVGLVSTFRGQVRLWPLTVNTR